MPIDRRKFLASVVAGATLPLLNLPSLANTKLKVAFVYRGPADDFGWTSSHERARQMLEGALGDQVETSIVEDVLEGGEAEDVLRRLVEQGNQLIFVTSSSFLHSVAKIAREFPDVFFEHTEGIQRTRNLATYGSRYYEGCAVTGTIAGHMSQSGRCGYIAAFPVPEVIRGINAFTLAARRVNPNFETRVVWQNAWYAPINEAMAAQRLVDRGADILAHHTDSPAVLKIAEKNDIFGFGKASDMSSLGANAHLASVTHEWGRYYIARTQAVLAGNWRSGDYLQGISTGMIALSALSERLTDKARIAAQVVENGIIAGTWHPFSGAIWDQTDVQRVAVGQVLTDSQLLAMDWFVKGVKS